MGSTEGMFVGVKWRGAGFMSCRYGMNNGKRYRAVETGKIFGVYAREDKV